MRWDLLNAQAKSNAQRAECAYGMLEELRLRHNAEGGRVLAGEVSREAFARWKAEWWRPRQALAVAGILDVRIKAAAEPNGSAARDIAFVAQKTAWKGSKRFRVNLDALDVAPGVPPPDPYEDLTTFTEVDANSDITLSSTTATFDTMRRDADSYVYKDYGASHFTNYEHDFEFRVSAADAGSDTILYGCTNDYGAFVDMSNGQIVYHSRTTDGSAYRILLYDKGNSNYDLYVCSVNTPYYLTVARSGTSGTCEIYTDSSRTSLADTLVVTVQNTAWRYLMCLASIRGGSYTDRTQTGYTKNFDIKETNAWSVTVSESLGLADSVAKKASITVSESLGLSDPLAKGVATTVAEALGLADSVAKAVAITLTEAVALTEFLMKGSSTTVMEAIGLDDALAFGVGKHIGEVLGLVDEATKGIGLTVEETLGLLDSALKRASVTVAESLGLSDTASARTLQALVGLMRAVCRSTLLRATEQATHRATSQTPIERATPQAGVRATDQMTARRATPRA